MAIDRSLLQPSIDCVKHIYATANGAASYQSLRSVLYLSYQIPCLITQTSATAAVNDIIDESNSLGNFRRCGVNTRDVLMCVRGYLLKVKGQVNSCALYLFWSPLGILMKRRPLQTCGACPTTARADSRENFDINDLCRICIQT